MTTAWDGTLPPEPPGAMPTGPDRTRFLVWAPRAASIDVRLVAPEERLVPLSRRPGGYYEGELQGVGPGARYFFRLDGAHDRPDPASRFQPLGVHGPSEVVDPSFRWTDDGWKGLPLEAMVLYELHVGTFTDAGTFEAVVPRLPSLRELGVTAIEIMPVAEFPGARNWGYDGASPYAVQSTYGGPTGLKRLVDACHREGMAVVLDVVYNHLGPEGNYLGLYGPYFTDRHRTPWGQAVNFDGHGSDEVRRFFVENALRWVDEFHVDGLRLDAIHAIIDPSARPFLAELARAVHAAQRRRPVYLIAESDLNDPRVVRGSEEGGLGLDAQWSDDFHHSLHALLTGESSGYYADFGRLSHLATAYTQAYVYAGQYSPFRGRRHGSDPRSLSGRQIVVYSQNHDQVGNRKNGDRLSTLVSFERLKLAAGAVALAPYLPMLFMGEEYGETAPFQFFVSHGDPALIEATRRGRREEFAAFKESGEAPDPEDPETFARSRLRQERASEGRGPRLRALYRDLLALRRSTPALSDLRPGRAAALADEGQGTIVVRRWDEAGGEAILILAFKDGGGSATVPARGGRWTRRIDSSDDAYAGPGSRAPKTLSLDRERTAVLGEPGFVLYTRDP